jgi:hypothetical protein
MQELARELRDRAVWVLARLSLAMLLAVMAALFVGSAAQGNSTADSSAAAQVHQSQPAHQGILDQASPLGVVLVGLIAVGGFGILLVGAFKPQRLGDQRDLAELLRD